MSIQDELNQIKNAVYGSDVRDAIHDSIKKTYDDASANGNANMEVNIARGTHPNLRSRLEEVDNKQQQTTAQLTQTATKNEMNQAIGGIAEGTPLFADSVSEMTDQSRLYVNTSDGMIYRYDGSNFVDTGKQYQSTGIAENSVSPKKTTYLKESYPDQSVNLFQGAFLDDNVTFLQDDGGMYLQKVEDSLFRRTGVVYLEPHAKYLIKIFEADRFRLAVLNSGSFTIPNSPDKLYLDKAINWTGSQLTIRSREIEFQNDANGKVLFINGYSGGIQANANKLKIEVNKFKFSQTSDIESDFQYKRNLFDGNWRKFGVGSGGQIFYDNPLFKTAIIRMKNNTSYHLRLFGNYGNFRIATSNVPYYESKTADGLSHSELTLDNVVTIPESNTYVFTNTDAVYLYIYSGILDEIPFLTITEGTSGPDKPVDIRMNGTRILTEFDEIENGSSSLLAHWTPPTVPAANMNLSYADFMALFEELRAKDPSYMNMIEVMKDSSDTYPIYEVDLTPRMYEETAFITAGIHGDEPESYWSIYHLVKALVESYDTHKDLRYIRDNVRLVILPVVAPWNYENFSRENVNGVNVNRNFEVSGSTEFEGDAPFSENEALAVKMTIDKYNADFAFHLDIHTVPPKYYEAGTYGAYSYIVPGSKMIYPMNEAQEYIVRLWNDKYDMNLNTRYHQSSGSTGRNYSELERQIPAVTLEFASLNFGNLADSSEMTRAVEWYGNVLITMSKHFGLKARVKSLLDL